jgi:hypothetical protein
MKDWFEWNGVRCTDHGIYVLEQPPPTIPKERVTYTDIPGRPGSLTTLEGDDVYEDVTLTAKCMVADPDVIPVLAGWLKGGVTVTWLEASLQLCEPRGWLLLCPHVKVHGRKNTVVHPPHGAWRA